MMEADGAGVLHEIEAQFEHTSPAVYVRCQNRIYLKKIYGAKKTLFDH